MVLTAGSHAAQAREPRQGLTAATVSDVPWVPWECLARASPDDMPPGCSQREVLGHFLILAWSRVAEGRQHCRSMPKTVAASTPSRRRRKSLGQHFLADPRVAQRIVAAAEPDGSDVVLEIGPGAGVLTRRLVEQAGKVVAVELDQRLAEELPGRLGFPSNLDVRPGDGREIVPDELVGSETPYKVVANLPYYAAAPIVRRFLETVRPPTLMVVMVQREVADAMNAKPGEFTLLSVATQFYAEPSVVVQVPARSFRPPPKVSSTVLKLAVRPQPAAAVVDTGDFFALVRAGFSAPRKQLRNSVAQGTGASLETVAAALDAAEIDPQRRPATLEIAEWAALDAKWPAGVPRSRNA